mgnify:CR=1 FL=1
MAKRSVGKPRFYADYPSYLKALGYYHGANVAGDISNEEIAHKVWNMNPAQLTEYEINPDEEGLTFRFHIDPATGDYPIIETHNIQLTQLLFQTNYAGLLGHNLGTLKDSANNTIKSLSCYFIGSTEYLAGQDNPVNTNSHQRNPIEIVNYTVGGDMGIPEYDGFSLWEITNFTDDNPVKYARMNFSIYSQDDHQGLGIPFGEDKIARIGAFTFGRYFEPEFAFDIQATLSTSYEGIKSQTTIGGNTITNINHLGQPAWGDLPAWTLGKQEGHDYKIGGTMGRRSWNVSLSFMTDDNVFSKAGNENKFFTWDQELGDLGYTFDSSLASFFRLTLNGKLPFIFCPDSSADDLEFALCRISNQPTFKQVANNMFSTSLTIVETY